MRCCCMQVLALPYVQGHMARFNAEERRRIFYKQTSLNGMRGLQPRADAGAKPLQNNTLHCAIRQPHS